MCVISLVEDGVFPSKKTLKQMESLNSDGGSIAWLNKNGTKSYRKGIKAKEVHNLINKKLIPQGVETAIIHFRIASIGGVKKKLCHPFEISSKVDMNLVVDNTTKDLLFHNGTWSEYADELVEYLKKQKAPVTIPRGEYSDSRIMAYLAHKIGHKGMAKLVKGWNKVAILTSNGIVKYGKNWCEVKNNECSNNYFVPTKMTTWGGGYNNAFTSNNVNYDYKTKSYTTGVTKYRGDKLIKTDGDLIGYLDFEEEQEMHILMDRYGITEEEIAEMLSDGTSIYDLERRLDAEEALLLQENISIEDQVRYMDGSA